MSILFGTLYSGSGGNSTVFFNGHDGILIDAGKTRKFLVSSLQSAGIPADSIRSIFITHDHGDHTSALHILTKYHNINVHCHRDTAPYIAGAVNEDLLFPHGSGFSEDICGIRVTSFPTSHDTDVSVGYRIDWNGRSFGYATDLGVFTDDVLEALRGCECVVLESNHDYGMLVNGAYAPGTKLRIASDRGHLSNSQAGEAAVKLARAGTKKIILAHLSKDNNTPVLALNTVRRRLSEGGYTSVPVNIEPEKKEVALCVALPDTPVLLDF